MTKVKKPKKPQNWHRADIIAALKKQNWSLRSLAKNNGINYSTLKSALDKPYPKMERIIAEAIGVPAEKIWAERFSQRRLRLSLKDS
ncbi:helix-turn-helix domain-containing protein [Rodentibacter caecimuris]|uniref:DNA-binding protein n=1 Tax=Rodentibacter caecimuris TaxID=1796644 RepID=A0ABX3KZI9_9PAST|nr:DNA-binding protein [Rodentibacter heylii]